MNSPRPSTEKIMQALFQLALDLNTNNQFKVMSRRMRHFSQVPPSEMPAFFQFQNPVRGTVGGERALPHDSLKVSWFCYLPGQKDMTTPVSPLMNQYYDMLYGAITYAPLGGQKNTLGGLVQACFVDGQSLTDEGLLQTQSLIYLPIKILVGI